MLFGCGYNWRSYGPDVSAFTVSEHFSDIASSSIIHSAKFPLIPGHEVIGTVVAVGPGEEKWKEGDRVGGPWHGGHDGTCKSCNRGLFQFCQNEAINGCTRNGGCTYSAGLYFLEAENRANTQGDR